MKKNRLKPDDRKEAIISTALQLAERVPYHQHTGAMIATESGVSRALVNRYFGTATQLRRAVIRAAVKRENLLVIAQGIVCRDSQVSKIDAELKARALGVL